MGKFFDIQYIFFKVLGYPMSYLEFFGTIAGALAVWLSAKANIWSWPVGIANVILFFFLFFQVQLYPDMFLQVFFLITNILGWWRWAYPASGEADRKSRLKISSLRPKDRIAYAALALLGNAIFGALASNLHEWLPTLFSKPSAFPYTDSFVTIVSIIATFLMIQKKVECWIAWIIVDVVATGMYFVKGIKFVGVEYLVFCIMAGFGLWHWMTEYRSYKSTQA